MVSISFIFLCLWRSQAIVKARKLRDLKTSLRTNHWPADDPIRARLWQVVPSFFFFLPGLAFHWMESESMLIDLSFAGRVQVLCSFHCKDRASMDLFYWDTVKQIYGTLGTSHSNPLHPRPCRSGTACSRHTSRSKSETVIWNKTNKQTNAGTGNRARPVSLRYWNRVPDVLVVSVAKLELGARPLGSDSQAFQTRRLFGLQQLVLQKHFQNGAMATTDTTETWTGTWPNH